MTTGAAIAVSRPTPKSRDVRITCPLPDCRATRTYHVRKGYTVRCKKCGERIPGPELQATLARAVMSGQLVSSTPAAAAAEISPPAPAPAPPSTGASLPSEAPARSTTRPRLRPVIGGASTTLPAQRGGGAASITAPSTPPPPPAAPLPAQHRAAAHRAPAPAAKASRRPIDVFRILGIGAGDDDD